MIFGQPEQLSDFNPLITGILMIFGQPKQSSDRNSLYSLVQILHIQFISVINCSSYNSFITRAIIFNFLQIIHSFDVLLSNRKYTLI
jgi:hypothetical protein